METSTNQKIYKKKSFITACTNPQKVQQSAANSSHASSFISRNQISFYAIRPAKNVGEQLEAVNKNVHVKNFQTVLHC